MKQPRKPDLSAIDAYLAEQRAKLRKGAKMPKGRRVK